MTVRFIILSFSLTCFLACNNKVESTTIEEATIEETTNPSITFETKPDQNKVEIRVDGELFTNYLYPEDIAKPILYPLTTVSGKRLTRGFPIDPQPGERTDHPHHVGYWFNYGDVNGLDFWNNSEAIQAADKERYGSIYHQEVTEVDEANGQLTVRSNWTAPDGETLLEETTTFLFSQVENTRIIDRSTTLRALVDIDFEDNKEGVVGLRVIKELELPSASEDLVTLVGNDGLPSSQKQNNTAANGDYLSSEGLTGNDVWGKRATWVKLEGEVDEETVSLTLIDHPDNVGYPTYWHARGYGLFAANPLGQAVFSDNKERLNFQLAADESVSFQYRLLIHNGSTLSKEAVDVFMQKFQE
jgi:hypothetical protein